LSRQGRQSTSSLNPLHKWPQACVFVQLSFKSSWHGFSKHTWLSANSIGNLLSQNLHFAAALWSFTCWQVLPAW
jgi:hypothetical protein